MPRRAPTLSVDAILAGLEEDGSPGDEATAAMLDATSGLLAAYGLRRWSVDDVATRSGLGRATVYRRFESRDELVHAALARDARRFFAAIAEAVAHIEQVEDKLVEGFLVGWRMVQEAPLSGLLTAEAATTLSLLTSAPVVALARAALVDSYRMVTGIPLSTEAAAEAELVAEALVRLGVSFVLMPDSVIDLGDTEAARRSVRRLLGPLLAG